MRPIVFAQTRTQPRNGPRRKINGRYPPLEEIREWYVDCPLCETTTGPHPDHQTAVIARNTHTCNPKRKKK